MFEISDATSVERLMREAIPLARAMDVRVLDYDGTRIALAAPLAPNVNDKGCAFGGSTASVLTLAGWALINLKLAEAGFAAEVFIQDMHLSYLEPVWGELMGEAYGREADWTEFFDTLRVKGRGRITIETELTAADGAGIAARASLRFVAKRPV